MRKKAFLIILAVVLILPVVTAQNIQVKNNPAGNWKFEAPYAPSGYTSGSIAVGLPEQKYTTTILFAGSDNKVTCEKVKVANDSISFSIYLEGQDVAVKLNMDSNSTMSGKAIYSDGDVSLSLSRDTLK